MWYQNNGINQNRTKSDKDTMASVPIISKYPLSAYCHLKSTFPNRSQPYTNVAISI